MDLYNHAIHRINLRIAVTTLAHVSTTMWRIELATYRTPMLRHLLHRTPAFDPVVCVLAILDCQFSLKDLLPLPCKSGSEEAVQIRIQSGVDVDHHNAGVFENLTSDRLKR